ncbi:basement membrane-specific heparan sulfate proteoglycan core protein-like isoform X2 [Glandiceps talaboti]
MATRRNSLSVTCWLSTTVLLVAVISSVVDSAKLGKEDKHVRENEKEKESKVVEDDDWGFFTDPDMMNTFDDEDYQNQEVGSGDFEGSGIIFEPGQTLYFRSTMAFDNIEYKESFANGFDDPEFQRVANIIETEVEKLFINIPGTQTATVVQLLPGSTIAILDIGTADNLDLQEVEDAVTSAILSGFVGSLAVDPTKFDIKLVGARPGEAPAVPCQADEFRCDNGVCIDSRGECDGYSDCPDRSDESNCPLPTPPIVVCGNDEFKCESGQCIESYKRCDRSQDCDDGTDEDGCIETTHPPSVTSVRTHVTANTLTVSWTRPSESDIIVAGYTIGYGVRQPDIYRVNVDSSQFQYTIDNLLPSTEYVVTVRAFNQIGASFPTYEVVMTESAAIISCNPGEFACEDQKQCIDESQQCDTFADCNDRSDEKDCPVTCGFEEFACDDKRQCVSIYQYCDGTEDCDDRSDEVKCPKACNLGEFMCKSGQCIDERRHCDSYPDCSDRSDEENCPQVPTTAPSTTEPKQCSRDESTCNNGECVKRDYVCDGDRDCTDGSDEVGCGNSDTCEPNEFRCEQDEGCIQKIWRCDGEEDCLDGSDESSCEPKRPGEACETWEYQCLGGEQCIPASYQCDGEIDCNDRSDEIGCSEPTILSSPEELVSVSRGQTVILTCEAEGSPMPIISWRLNWGHVSSDDRVSSTSINGIGILTINNAQEVDSGAYTCEAMNNKGYKFAVPDAIVVVTPPEGICQETVFNEAALVPEECVVCFCFGIVRYCVSSSYHKSQESLYFNEAGNTKGVELIKYNRGGVQPIDNRYLQVQTVTGELAVQDFTTQLGQGDFYWMLPAKFTGNQLTSYGGSLQYMIMFDTTQIPRSSSTSDVIVRGNGITIQYRMTEQPTVGVQNERSVEFKEFGWERVEEGRGDIPQPATRADMMMVLENIELFLIKASYHSFMTYSSLSDISLDVAIPQTTGQGKATLVEDCQCPTGYGGLSCEECASGYRRVKNNEYLGVCVPCDCNGHSEDCDGETGECTGCRDDTVGERCDQCAPGYYGDAVFGICQKCECPLSSPSNNFSPTCHLDSRDNVICDDCPRGYTGDKCERCETGYSGNPSIPGGKCVESTDLKKRCDDNGSNNPGVTDENCDCKRYVEGEFCNECRENTFFLSSDNPEGCISCFCSGMTDQCKSTIWNRAQVRSTFSRADEFQGFTLVNSLGVPAAAQIAVNPASRELLFAGFSTLSPGVYYYQLPGKFRGDKVTAYGGYLRYSISHRAAPSAARSDEPDVILQGNGITLYYFGDQSFSPSSDVEYNVPFYESFWQRPDGAPAMREFLMMALADVELLMLRATLTTNTFESSISDVSMDIAEPRPTGQPQAFTVEECECPTGYRGLSCEDCDIGYTRSEGGLYLGTCMSCECNGHATDCDSETGECTNCLHNTEGPNCDQCIPGYYGDPSVGRTSDCQPCPCPLTTPPNQFSPTCFLDTDGLPTCNACPTGYTGRNCERCERPYTGNPSRPGGECERSSGEDGPCQCDTRGSVGTECDSSEQCPCKTNAGGSNCDVCKAGHFNLDSTNSDGCTPCFCMGVTDQCSSSNYYRRDITVTFDSLTSNKNVALVNSRQSSVVDRGFTISVINNEIKYSAFDLLPQGTHFWALPPKFRGNQITAYGGLLKFTVSCNAASSGDQINDLDIGIEGSDINLYHRFYPPLRKVETRRFEISMTEDNFYRFDGQRTTREHMLMVLADVRYIHIRASYYTDMIDSSLRDIAMEIAVPQNTGQQQATEVEQCSCPEGYMGLSCQSCSPGYMRTGGGLYLGTCMKCECNGHATECDPDSGECVNCEDNTVGERCDQCAPGYYGDATAGTPGDCRQCACPLSIPSNQFSTSCYLDVDNQPTCGACQEGYTGRTCDRCALGYSGDPTSPGGKCLEDFGERRPPEVDVSPSRISDSVGATVTFYCGAVGTFTRVIWARADGLQLSSRAIQLPDNSLQIRNIERSDEGVYVCQASNDYGIGVDEGRLTVLGAGPPIQVIVDEPTSIQVAEGENIRIVCRAISQVTYTTVWTKEGGSLPAGSTDFMGILTIPNIKTADSGTYTCTGSNQFAMDVGTAQVNVLGVTLVEPTARIEPRFQEVIEGEQVVFTCIVTGFPPPTVTWTGGKGGVLNPSHTVINGVLTIPEVDRSDEAEYHCEATNSEGTAKVRTVLYVKASDKPKVTISPPDLTIGIGDQAVFLCTATGNPQPTVAWTKMNEPLPADAREQNGYLIIPRVTEEDAGSYLCKATNDLDIGEGVAILTVRTQTIVRPTIVMEPERQSIPQGGTAVIRCVVAGDPAPSVTWSRARGELAPNHQILDNVLRIVQAQSDDSDTYFCTAQNIGGSVTQSAVVEIEVVLPCTRDPCENNAQCINQIGGYICLCGDGYTGSNCETELAEIKDCASDVCQNGATCFDQRDGYICACTEGWTGQDCDEDVLECVSDPCQNGASCIEQENAYACQCVLGWTGVHCEEVLRNQEPPTIVIVPTSDLVVGVGEEVQFTCVVTRGYPPPQLTWSRAANLQFTDRTELFEDGTISLTSVTTSEQGTYICTAQNSAGSVQATARLRVQGLPSVSINPSGELEVKVGDQISLECVAEGDPMPSLTWERMGNDNMPESVEIVPDTENSGSVVFRIMSASMDDSGIYVCRASSPVGQVEDRIVLNVIEDIEFGPPVVKLVPTSLSVVEGDPAQFACDVPGAVIDFTIVWRRTNGLELPSQHSVRNGVLYIPYVRGDDAGEYICQGINAFGSTEAIAQLVVQVAPVIRVSPSSITVKAGQVLKVECVVEGGSEPVQVEWYKVEGQLPLTASDSDGILLINSATPADAGPYKCVATNPAGSNEAVVSVSVRVPPTVKVIPAKETRAEGGAVEFQCTASGTPTPTIEWTKEDGRLPPQHAVQNGLLSISNVRQNDAGRYVCTATNSGGTSTAFAVLSIQALPQVRINVRTRVQTVPIGDMVTFDCQATGEPKPIVRWDKMDGELPSNVMIRGGVLTLTDVQTSYAGTYTCTATNSAGSVMSMIVLYVQAAPQVTISPETRTVAVGAPATFTCLATGSPTPDIYWYKLRGDLPLSHTVRNGVLTIPQVVRADAGTYVCRASNRQGSKESLTILGVGEMVPSFIQSPVSYISYPALTNAYLQFQIKISFKPDSSDGFIIYNGQTLGQLNQAAGDFLSFGMSGGYAELRYDMGSGAAIIRSAEPLELGQWHTVVLDRNRRQGSLTVDGGNPVSGSSLGGFQGLDLSDLLFLGGMPEEAVVSKAAGFTKGFIGCVSRLEINGLLIDLGGNAKSVVGVKDCPVCQERPCQNGGTCREATTEYGYRCLCRTGYAGRTCEDIGERCYPGACGDGQCQNNAGPSGFRCICPPGKAGERCETGM